MMLWYERYAPVYVVPGEREWADGNGMMEVESKETLESSGGG
jgi:hypothetical protein